MQWKTGKEIGEEREPEKHELSIVVESVHRKESRTRPPSFVVIISNNEDDCATSSCYRDSISTRAWAKQCRSLYEGPAAPESDGSQCRCENKGEVGGEEEMGGNVENQVAEREIEMEGRSDSEKARAN